MGISAAQDELHCACIQESFQKNLKECNMAEKKYKVPVVPGTVTYGSQGGTQDFFARGEQTS